MCEKLWPFKSALINYLTQAFLDSGDKTFASEYANNLADEKLS